MGHLYHGELLVINRLGSSNSAEQVAVEAADVLTELWVQLHHLIGPIEQQLTARFQQPHFEVVSHLEIPSLERRKGPNGYSSWSVSGSALPIRFLSNSTASSDFLAPRKMMNVGVYSLDHANE